jgi:hypothetical protein
MTNEYFYPVNENHPNSDEFILHPEPRFSALYCVCVILSEYTSIASE